MSYAYYIIVSIPRGQRPQDVFVASGDGTGIYNVILAASCRSKFWCLESAPAGEVEHGRTVASVDPGLFLRV